MSVFAYFTDLFCTTNFNHGTIITLCTDARSVYVHGKPKWHTKYCTIEFGITCIHRLYLHHITSARLCFYILAWTESLLPFQTFLHVLFFSFWFLFLFFSFNILFIFVLLWCLVMRRTWYKICISICWADAFFFRSIIHKLVSVQKREMFKLKWMEWFDGIPMYICKWQHRHLWY